MANARNVGGIRARSTARRPVEPAHYLTKREAAEISRKQRTKEEARGIFRRWNDRQLTPDQQRLVDEQKKRTAFHARRKKSAKSKLP